VIKFAVAISPPFWCEEKFSKGKTMIKHGDAGKYSDLIKV
jgi:hypothetical protein